MQEILKQGYIGNPDQLVTLRRVKLEEGKGKGTQIIEVKTAGGLELDVLTDNGLDIGQCRYKGINMSYLSKNGYDSPAIDSPYENEFVNTFPGGLLYTCGSRSAGPANRDNGEWHPLHGRHHSLAAEHVSAKIENDMIEIEGTIRETALFSHVLETRRKISIPVFGSKIIIEDLVSNLSFKDEEYMKIYHCNFGYPLLSEEAVLILPEKRKTIPRTEFAKSGLGKECTFEKPVPNEEERVFFQLMEERNEAVLKNLAIGIGMKISWSGDTLPILSQWRSMAAGDYVLGLEPTNCYIMGRNEERKNGTLPVLRSFESIENRIEIEFTEEK